MGNKLFTIGPVEMYPSTKEVYKDGITYFRTDEYSKITVIDTRYVNSLLLGNLVDFHGQDVLFIYSTLILNNSMSMH